jgi:hypothetical protein
LNDLGKRNSKAVGVPGVKVMNPGQERRMTNIEKAVFGFVLAHMFALQVLVWGLLI